MSAQQKNLLEAFRNAGGGSKPPASAPKAPEGPARPPVPPPPRAPRAWRPGRAPAWLPWVAAIGVAFVLGVLVGRSSRSVSRAAGGGAEEVSEGPRPGASLGAPAPVARPTPPAHGVQSEAPENPLLDPQNQYTVVAASYGLGKAEYAWATHDQMHEVGLPVFAPWQREKDILVLVGAAPSKDDLRDVEARLRRLDGWDGAKDAYADAYIDRIDKIIDRAAAH